MITRGGYNWAKRCRQGPYWPTFSPLLLSTRVPAGAPLRGRRESSPVHQLLVIRQRVGAHEATCSGRQRALSQTSSSRCSIPFSWPARASPRLGIASGTARAAVSDDATTSGPFVTRSATTHTADCTIGDNPAAVRAAGGQEALFLSCAPRVSDQAALNSLPTPVRSGLGALAFDDKGESSAWKQTQLVRQASAFPSLISQTLHRTEASSASEKAAHPIPHGLSGKSTSISVACYTDRGGEIRKVPQATYTPSEGKLSEVGTPTGSSREHRRCQPLNKRGLHSHEVLQESVEAVGDARTMAAPRIARERKAESGARQHEIAALAASQDSAPGSATKPKSRQSSVALASGAEGAVAVLAVETPVTPPSVSLPVVPTCSGCSLNSASAWKKWLQLLSETDAQRRQQSLLQKFPICKRHPRKQASGSGRAVVNFQRLLQLLDAAALHPHATADAVAVLRQRVRLGVGSPASLAPESIPAVKAATNLSTAAAPEPTMDEGKRSASVTSGAAARLAYVERGLSTLALEKGAQLLQSLRDFDCTGSFLIEATAACGAPRVGFAPPRWSFRVLEGPLKVQASRQKITMERMEAGTLLILKPVDQKSAALSRELRRLHGKSFDFSFVSAHGHIESAAGVPLGTGGASYANGGVLDAQQQHTGILQRVRCAMCGKWLFFSVEELLQPQLRCPDCGGAATEVLASTLEQPASGSGASQVNSQLFLRSQDIDSHGLSQGRWLKGSEGDTLGNLYHVLQELEAVRCLDNAGLRLASDSRVTSHATIELVGGHWAVRVRLLCSQAAAWTGCRFALPGPAFIASVGSQGSGKTLKVRVFPLSSGAACSNTESSRGRRLQNATTADVQPHDQQQKREKEPHMSGSGFAVGSQFWAMPVSFIEAVHARQVDALARLANVSLLAHLPSTSADASSKEVGRLSHIHDNHILKILTACPEARERVLSDGKRLAAEGEGAANITSVVVKKHESHPGVCSKAESDGSTLALHASFTPRQYEAVSAATSKGSCIVSIEGPPGTGKTAVAAAVVREWLSKCMYTSAEPCVNPRCPCKSPIFVAAGTHAALRSLKNKLDQEGILTYRLSNTSVVSAATDKKVTSQQGHRLATLGLRPRRILVDESSQLTEFAGLLALIHGADVAVLIGDEKQLPPASVLPPSWAPRSLFSALKGDACRSVLLNHQFRMPPLLAAFISAHFYEGKLFTHPSKAALSQLPHLPTLEKQQSATGASGFALGCGSGECPAPSTKNTAGRSAPSAAWDLYGAGSPICWKGSNFPVETPRTTEAALISSNSLSPPSFPWPDSSEGDRDLALRLLQQLEDACGPADKVPGTSEASHVNHQLLPRLLPILFIDTSLWAVGHSGKLARLVTPSAALDKPAPISGDARAAPEVLAKQKVEERTAVFRSLPAEQRVKGSLQNSLEAFLVYRCVKALLRDGISPKDIAVLTPYQAQAQLLSRVLHPTEMVDKAQGRLHRSARLSFVQPVSSNEIVASYILSAILDVLDERCRPHPQVSTVDGFQGHERQYVILSAVKCSRRSANEFFLFDPRRINVALSRAGRGLIIVGSAQALTDASPTWGSFLLFLRALGAALPLDHPSLRAALTNDLLLPRPAEAHSLTASAGQRQLSSSS